MDQDEYSPPTPDYVQGNSTVHDNSIDPSAPQDQSPAPFMYSRSAWV